MNTYAIEIVSCNNLTIKDITWIGCGVNNDEIGAIVIFRSSVIIQKSDFQYSVGPAIQLIPFFFHNESFVMIDQCNYMNNNYYRGHGAAIALSFDLPGIGKFRINNTTVGTLKINNCNFCYNEGAKSIVYLENTHVAMYYNNTFYNNQGVPIYMSHNCSLHISGDILFKNNRAENGAGIYIRDHSTVIFGENSNVKFINNSVDYNGSVIFMNSYSSITFEQNSIATFNNNKDISGTIYSEDNSNITFTATSRVIFNSNSVMQCGAAIYSFDNSHLTFTGSSNVTFSKNVVSTNERSRDMEFGGIIFSSTNSHIIIV